MAVFGKTIEGAHHHECYNTHKMACRFSLTEEGIISFVSVHLTIVEPAPTGIKVAIFDDLNNAPNNLLTSGQANVSYGANFKMIPVTEVTLPPGDYWLAWKVEAYGWDEARWAEDNGATGQFVDGIESYADGWASPWTGGNYMDLEASIYATYVPTGAVKHVVTLDSTPTGVTYIQPPGTAPLTVQVEDGGELTIEAPSVVEIGGITYDFSKFTVNAETFTDNPVTITNVTSDLTITAVCTERPPEEVIVQTDFSSGMIDPFEYYGAGTYEVLPPAQDPLGTGEYCVKLTTAPAESGRSSLMLRELGVNYGYINAKIHVAMPNPADNTGVLMLGHPNMYGTGKAFLMLDVYNQWRVSYLDNGSMNVRNYFGSVNPNQKYGVQVILKIGHGNGEVHVLIDGVELFTRIGLVNDTVLPVCRALEVGTFWGSPSATVYVYDVDIKGIVKEIFSVTGRVVDADILEPLAEVAVGCAMSPTFTGTDGTFALELVAGIYEIKFIKVGRELKILPVTLTGNMDLGDISLATVTERPPPAVQTAPCWRIRAFTIFPYWFTPDGTDMDVVLDEIKTKFGDGVNYIDLRAYHRCNPTTHLPEFHGDPHAESSEGRANFEQLAAGAQKAHTRGLGVILGCVRCWRDPTPDVDLSIPANVDAWFSAYKDYVLEIATFAEENKIEAVEIGWELHFRDSRFEDGTWNSYWSAILTAVRQVYHGLVSFHTNDWYQQTRWESLHYNDWWKNLDFLSISAFVPLTNKLDPTVEELKAGWKGGPEGWDYPAGFAELSTLYGIPIQINLSYSMGDGTNMAPYGSPPGKLFDEREQADCWDAFFQVFKNQTWVEGATIEHFDKVYTAGSVTAGFRDAFSEQYIKPGLLSHIQEEAPPPKPDNIGLILLGLAALYVLFGG